MTSQDESHLFQDDLDDIPQVKQVVHSKHHKPEINGRVGRLYRAESRYRRTKTHEGKGKTLRDHRRGSMRLELE